MVINIANRADNMKKTLFKYIAVFVCVLSVLTLALWASTKLPQERIDRNVESSYERLNFEGLYGYVLDNRRSSVLDNFTDSIILTVCKSSAPQTDKGFLTNPFFGNGDPLTNLGKFCAGEIEPDSFYGRYWLGFRIFLRPLLEITDLQYIRYMMIAAFFAVLGMVVLSVCRNLSMPAGAAFFISIYLIRPYVCSRCMQYFCCPMIAMTAMLFVPLAERKLKSCPIFFMVIGMVTMFFDFYTVPVLTFGLPMIYLISIRAKKGSPMRLRAVLSCLALWAVGYLMTWVVKLSIMDIFTDQPGFSIGIGEIGLWMGKNPEAANFFASYIGAFDALKKVILPDMKTTVIMAALLFAVIAIAVLSVRKGYKAELKKGSTALLVGLLPIIWFAAATFPITMHAFFQYRSIAVTYWAIGAWISGSELLKLKHK